ncbi:GGDEF domain-containing protein [Massilia arenosa]|uniref:diguanylate cyclase n=1 Tax=Zemynaea arenosa TaxID=2561931 RepID=A0A4Y9SM68_9BURK|nr:GGDEF domain-containing protein [Massilia arenosa]TFW23285.1 GGDEF domain-containing protein [Massilia arenosa]
MEQIGTLGASPYRLSDLQLFSGVDTDILATRLASCAVLRLPAGERLEDTFQARLYIVLSGVLNVEGEIRAGTSDNTLTKVYPGESVGEQSVLDEQTNLSAITAVETADLLVIESDLVWDLIDHHNGVARNLLRLLSFRVRAANALLRRRQKLGEFYRQLSLNDGLTGLYNRAWLNDVLPGLVKTAHGNSAPLSLIMLDIDHFKRFNDTHGHQAGDAALRTTARVLSSALRPSDFAVRYGGEELMVILPDTPETAALMIAERLCKRLRTAVVFEDASMPLPQVTASFGVASLQAGQDEHALVAHADAALYRAKEGGRNRASL